MSDHSEQLIESAVAGDPKAVEGLLVRSLPGLRAFTRLRAGDVVRAKEPASDRAQSVCHAALPHIDRFPYRGEAGLEDRLFTAALGKLASWQKFDLAVKRDAAREANPVKQDSDVRLSAVRRCGACTRRCGACTRWVAGRGDARTCKQPGHSTACEPSVSTA